MLAGTEGGLFITLQTSLQPQLRSQSHLYVSQAQRLAAASLLDTPIVQKSLLSSLLSQCALHGEANPKILRFIPTAEHQERFPNQQRLE